MQQIVKLPRSITALIWGLFFALTSPTLAETRHVWLETTHGPILLELDAAAAPITVGNFLNYVDEGFYDGLVFHRVVPGFVIQAGAYTRQLQFRAPTRGAIQGEPANGLSNSPYTIAMGLIGSNRDSAQAQFYINVSDNNYLDDDFTVFGRVVAGQTTVDRINRLLTTSQVFNTAEEVPLELPTIVRATQTSGYPLMPLHTGSWYNEQTSGTGFNIEITNDASTEAGPLAVVYWYDFNQGEQIWLTGVQGFEWGEHEITLELITAQSPIVGADFRQPPDSFDKWGTLTIAFESCQRGKVTYSSPTLGSQVIDVVRLTLPTDASCEGL